MDPCQPHPQTVVLLWESCSNDPNSGSGSMMISCTTHVSLWQRSLHTAVNSQYSYAAPGTAIKYGWTANGWLQGQCDAQKEKR